MSSPLASHVFLPWHATDATARKKLACGSNSFGNSSYLADFVRSCAGLVQMLFAECCFSLRSAESLNCMGLGTTDTRYNGTWAAMSSIIDSLAYQMLAYMEENRSEMKCADALKFPMFGKTWALSASSTPSQSAIGTMTLSQGKCGIILPLPRSSLFPGVRSNEYWLSTRPPLTAPPSTKWLPAQPWSLPPPLLLSVLPNSE